MERVILFIIDILLPSVSSGMSSAEVMTLFKENRFVLEKHYLKFSIHHNSKC